MVYILTSTLQQAGWECTFMDNPRNVHHKLKRVYKAKNVYYDRPSVLLYDHKGTQLPTHGFSGHILYLVHNRALMTLFYVDIRLMHYIC
jgi:hypothetical protein